ncbi:hypothetical protein Pcinc_019236 [Petrolisthes cinctipes]|uniref:Uncharacterized protein n=1 Tax=Petrolisthes cinctipes TaxID=88211 RepID=A0AAE1FLU1_PETCI|nr:hypothetical protein Pcinc_019236 [Petrolisthes cinctipes]
MKSEKRRGQDEGKGMIQWVAMRSGSECEGSKVGKETEVKPEGVEEKTVCGKYSSGQEGRYRSEGKTWRRQEQQRQVTEDRGRHDEWEEFDE